MSAWFARFQHTAARRRLGREILKPVLRLTVSTHSRPKAAGAVWSTNIQKSASGRVSTHSRPKAAGAFKYIWRFEHKFQHTAARRRLGLDFLLRFTEELLFQHTAARRRLAGRPSKYSDEMAVSTHSRPKAAGLFGLMFICTHDGFNTQPPEGGWFRVKLSITNSLNVSTHSRPKAAGCVFTNSSNSSSGFNTQPPEGGWKIAFIKDSPIVCFNTQPPEGGWQGVFE